MLFWLIIVPILAIVMIALISKFVQSGKTEGKDDKDGGNIYRQTIYREDD